MAFKIQYFLLLISSFAYSQKNSDYLIKQEAWASETLANMSLEEKIGQLFVVSCFSNRNENDYSKMENTVRKYNLGGVIFFQGFPVKQAELTNRYQAASKIPMFIGLDAEWGLGMRLEDAMSFPKAITLGATNSPETVEKIAFEIGKQCKRIGVNFNFAPDADLNSNPKNPVINYRSFGESPSNVSDLVVAFNRGLKKAKIMGSAKHFPGHGDTDVDSHRDLPVLNHSKQTLEQLDVIPFKKLIADSVASVMIGHLYVPALEDKNNIPASVSQHVVNDFLKNDLQFDGLVITDALNMRGLIKYYPVGQAEVKAFEAGNDLLLQTANIDIAFNKIRNKLLDSTLSMLDLDIKVKKILKAKYWLGLNNYKPVEMENISADINNQSAQDIINEVYHKAITIVRDEEGLLPLRNLSQISLASLAINIDNDNAFQKYLSQYSNIKNYSIPFKPSKPSDWQNVVHQAASHELVIVSVHGTHNADKRNFGITSETIEIIKALANKTKIIVCVFANPYSLRMFDGFQNLICGFEDEPAAHLAMANVIFGVQASLGKIPVNTLSEDAKLNDGIESEGLGRLGYEPPKNMGFNKDKLLRINDIVSEAIQNEEFPGCQILVARKGKVVYHESFGNLRYGFNEPVNNQTVYDIASISKVAATLQVVMQLYDQKKLDINQKISYYIPEMAKTNKGNLIIKDILLHQAGLQAFIPMWKKTMLGDGSRNPEYYIDSSQNHLNITSDIFIIPSIKDSVYKWIDESSLISGNTKYVYSDLGLILLQRLIEKITKTNLDIITQNNFYKPLGMASTGYNIIGKLEKKIFAPTEIENVWRKEQIVGYVHDPNAALLGGVAGHAGIFTNAWDLAKLMQMNLNKGLYGGMRYFSPETIQFFTKRQSEVSHRGLGWNKPTVSDGSVSEYASASTFGHTGFTGTAVWVDPEKELIYIFLSNRVYPDADNNKILKNKTRKKIHDAIYMAIEK